MVGGGVIAQTMFLFLAKFSKPELLKQNYKSMTENVNEHVNDQCEGANNLIFLFS